MELYVIRHAIAEDLALGAVDSDRELTSDGARRLKRAAKGMRELGWHFDRVIVSPWKRAIESAALLGSLCDDEPIVTPLLTQSPRAELLAMISENTGGDHTCVVGHEPWLGELVAWLAFGDTRHGEALRLKKAGAVVLSGTAVPGGMQIQAIVPPAILRAIAG